MLCSTFLKHKTSGKQDFRVQITARNYFVFIKVFKILHLKTPSYFNHLKELTFYVIFFFSLVNLTECMKMYILSRNVLKSGRFFLNLQTIKTNK